jgi:hypothetical protein
MFTFYELMDAYRSWWRASHGTEPSPQYAVMAAAFTQHFLATYRASINPPTGEETP